MATSSTELTCSTIFARSLLNRLKMRLAWLGAGGNYDNVQRMASFLRGYRKVSFIHIICQERRVLSDYTHSYLTLALVLR